MEKILIVEDDVNINNLINEALGKKKYECTQAFSGSEALLRLQVEKFNLLILDLMLPGANGEEVLKKIRELNNIPVIVVSAKDELDTKVDVLAMGADDYITKPFQPLELVARVKAQLRRYAKYGGNAESMGKEGQHNENVIDFRNIVINSSTHEFYLNDERIDLTPIEFSILWLLCKNRGNVVKTDELFMDVWKEKYYEKDNNTVMVHIRHLREKMNDNTKKQKYIKTVWGVGYKIEK